MEKLEKKFTVMTEVPTLKWKQNLISLEGEIQRSEYHVAAKKTATLDMVWASEQCWFLPGTKVTIKDEFGNEKTYVKEG